MDRLQSIKHANENKWLSVNGVVSVGIGKTRTNKEGIIIGVEKVTQEVTANIPFEVEGIPVEIVKTGTIKAH
ncbi:MAG: hypothetical protein GF313_03340 [Caldithrix sp.]|nr:hypothetical protein [Caldithrix sp.]